MKRCFLCVALFCSLCLTLPLANAQAGSFDAAIGFGTVNNGSVGSGLDYPSLYNYGVLVPCTAATDAYCSGNASHLGGFFLGFNGDYMLTKKYGVGAELGFQPSQQNYVSFGAVSPGESVKSRLLLYDINGIVRPYSRKHFALQAEGGFGGASLRFYDTISASSLSGNQSQYISSANHFQLHAGVGIPIYLKSHFFIRPQFDIHYAPNFSQDYSSDVITKETLWVGYSFR